MLRGLDSDVEAEGMRRGDGDIFAYFFLFLHIFKLLKLNGSKIVLF